MRKTIKRVIDTAWGIYALLVFSTFLSVADQQLGKAGLLPLPATLSAVACLLPFAAAALQRALTRRDAALLLGPLRANLIPILLFAIVSFWSLLLAMLPEAYWGDGAKWIFLVAYGFIIAVLAIFVPSVTVARRWFPAYAMCALLLLLGSMYMDLIYPGTYSTVPSRAAGFPGNSNFAALVTAMICASALDYSGRRPRWINAAFIIVGFLDVLFTMSRSGFVNFGALLCFYCYQQYLRGGLGLRAAARMGINVTCFLAFVVFLLPLLSSDLGLIQKESRLAKFMDDERIDDGSAESRMGAVKESLRLIDESPLLGHGTGHSRTMEELPHNVYLQQWVNNGLPGLLSYVAFLAVCFRIFSVRGYEPGQAFVLVAVIGGVFSHNILDQRPFLMLLGLHLGASSFATTRVRDRAAAAVRNDAAERFVGTQTVSA